MKKRLVIFDLDGTLVDTIDDLALSANHALGTEGYPTHELARYRAMVGGGIRKLIERALPEQARCEASIERVRREMVAWYDHHDTVHSRPYPGISELLVDLAERGVAMAVASNKYNAATRRIVAHFFPDVAFVAVFGQRKNVKLKPDPMVVRHVLKAAKIGAGETLFVGDSVIDVETARAAGVESVAVSWGFCPRAELEAARPDHIVDHAQQIVRLV
ncbi:phosphoglycolate phosphatase [Bacteroidia bacterium]|nr:phosphoglycolate phosphatase [Bacteroidia bacterium]